jgi:hypothetical protein
MIDVASACRILHPAMHLHMQVFVHALQRVDMRAVAGQSTSTSLAVAGGTVERQVACYSSHPDELQVSPDVLQLSAGGISALQLVFKPLHAGRDWVSRCHWRYAMHGWLQCTV